MIRIVKTLVTAWLVTAALALTAQAEPSIDPEGVVDAAKELIAAEQWATAAETLQSLHDSGHRSPETLEAQGVALARANRTAEAKAAFLQSLALDPSRAADLMAKMNEIEPLATDESRGDQLTVLAAVSPTTSLWVALSASFWFTIVVLLVRRTLWRHGLATLALVIGICFTLASATALIGRSLLPPASDIAVVVKDDTLRSVPLAKNTSGPVVGAGSAAVIKEKSGEFTLVKQMNKPHNEGWVRSEYVVEILPDS
ncbi:tetratricopeptide repeat protein [Sulfuriroseicoccus oceanibius]|uniref:Tetratricopeptide repeat protein n=1 Tax=Sulfuriroseicoccus oceanibius TaxID=2707525 RepID=A0A6B3LFP9_9BACT|nr:tetratricopeptide repeat protein [Sulfuriroseicoccus oceanibius]QQL45176.1 tetratricopeptide repeat protein [Sulfuriroseicoccus oceanibius]